MTDARLLGLWETDPGDAKAVEEYGRARLHFFESGDLTYTICSREVDQIIRLTYSVVEGNTITTQQPSAPREEKTQYAIERDGRLALTHDGIVSWYRRIT